jgi:hypothetical protein
MGCFGSKIDYVNIKSIENIKIENNKYYNTITYYDTSEQDVILNEKQEKKLQQRFKYHKMYLTISKIKYIDIKEITKFEILDKENTDNEKNNYKFLINYNDDLMMSKIYINKYQLRFFLSMMKIHKVKCNVDFIKQALI